MSNIIQRCCHKEPNSINALISESWSKKYALIYGVQYKSRQLSKIKHFRMIKKLSLNSESVAYFTSDLLSKWKHLNEIKIYCPVYDDYIMWVR